MSGETDLSEETRADAAPEDLEDLALDEDYALTSEFVDMVIDAADRGDGARHGANWSARCTPPTSPT